jgi:hypothetical protein
MCLMPMALLSNSQSNDWYDGYRLDLATPSIRLIHLHHLAEGESPEDRELSCDMKICALNQEVRRYFDLSYIWDLRYTSSQSDGGGPSY